MFNNSKGVDNYSNLNNNEKKEIGVNEDIKINKNNNEFIDKINKNIEMIKKIRINNALSKFNKKELLEFKKDVEKIKQFLNNSDYSSIVSLILDGELKVKGDNYLIFVYNSESLVNFFNSEIISVEKILKMTFNVNYRAISVNNNDWEIIKKEFNNNMKNKNNVYIYQEEDFNVEELLNISNKGEEIVKNDIDNLFAEIVEYK